ncbi:MAG: DUF4167 domain-containing protein [Alphaproteobacteria bacterium]|nr:DUF4167 domain-containing protein [Alphaproteobacteria bacterium]
MKKINNNKFRGSTVYSLNYKFDSVSVAGKFSGTALDLIKRYNELAKEAQSNGNYVEMEVFRQYAEHYRKIVTEINERKNQHREYQNENQQNAEENTEVNIPETGNNNLVETQAAEPEVAQESSVPETPVESENKPRRGRRSLKVVEVSDDTVVETPKETRKRRSPVRLKKVIQTNETEA